MTPAARVAAAIDVLDMHLGGMAAEKSLTSWARKNRYAGSKDRAAVRDLVFSALRQKRSLAWLGGGDTGRALMIGLARGQGDDLAMLFSGEGYSPSKLTEAEQTYQPDPSPGEAVRLDCPDWLWPVFNTTYGDAAVPILENLQSRAPVFLRVNTRKGSAKVALAQLAADGIEAQPHGLCDTALEVTANPRKVKTSQAYQSGLVELQDAASQAVVELFRRHIPGPNVLDYCAGGGGKALAMAADAGLNVTAHDAQAERMKDLPARAKRAGVKIALAQSPKGPFDAVLCDVPCSGSGAWRRQPEQKWRLTQAMLDTLLETQRKILQDAAALVRPGGVLGYATCSLLPDENASQSDAFLTTTPGWRAVESRQFTPLDGADGFFVVVFQRDP